MAKKKTETKEKEETINNNAVSSLKTYKEILAKNNLEEIKLYKTNFTLKLFPSGEEKISKVKFKIIIDNNALSPFIDVECFKNDTEIGSFGIMKEELILDRYDRAAIKNELENFQVGSDYNSKLFKKLLDKMKIVI